MTVLATGSNSQDQVKTMKLRDFVNNHETGILVIEMWMAIVESDEFHLLFIFIK